MSYLSPADRFAPQLRSLEDFVDQDNAVRFLDAFVEHLDLVQLSFIVPENKKEGRPSYHPKVFLKLYLYGYLNRIRSSRRLEKETHRNLEVHWLLGRLTPNYHSIADFRKVNPKALKKTFTLFVHFLNGAGLLSSQLLAVDGTKIRASNSKKNNFNPKKIDRHLAYIEEKVNQYLEELDANDQKETPEKIIDIPKKIARLKEMKIRYEAIKEQLEQGEDLQISLTDPDARALLVQGQVVEVSYNVETAVDAQHNLLVATHTINNNDRNALSAIALEAQTNLSAEGFTLLADKGYHNGREIETCQKANIATIVVPPTVVNSNQHGTTPDYLVSKFIYNSESDTYTCPAGSTLATTGTWHKKTRERDSYQFKKYRTPDCKTCSVKQHCTGRAKGGREIERSQYAEAVEKNQQNYQENKGLYRKRQEMNEHIFGTIKRQWGYNYTNLRGLEKVNGEMALIMTVYNIRRVLNILGIEELMAQLKVWKPDYRMVICFVGNRLEMRRYETREFPIRRQAA